ncbi:hypothetical protein BDM02DRAFT_2008732 [Thelephora ganbajun]|uniref:Uncharacterized protein n=1 Tax=Thelephora ganbajun TaxID=370292 RepID=A0ACB6YZ62_THEGA|nr:hypothetical protein BDM02DRAFT_2008732 [Thelephora ganbajun]
MTGVGYSHCSSSSAERVDHCLVEGVVLSCCRRPQKSFRSVTIPQKEDPRLEKLAKTCESCRPMSMFRSNKDEFLLCYDGMCWLEGPKAERANDFDRVWAVCRQTRRPKPSYRYSRVGRDGRAGRIENALHPPFRRPIHRNPTRRDQSPGSSQLQKQYAIGSRVHGVMSTEAPRHAFELIPTVPLFLPGSLVSPSHASYFHQSNSPPHPPKLNPACSFR